MAKTMGGEEDEDARWEILVEAVEGKTPNEVRLWAASGGR
jgi:hypothetical protein